jgi:hypothetical protein
MHKFEIDTGINSKGSKIFMDGKELEGVSGLKINMRPHEVPTIILEIIPQYLSVSGELMALKEVERVGTKPNEPKPIGKKITASELVVKVTEEGLEETKMAILEVEKIYDRVLEKQKQVKELCQGKGK